MPEIKASKIFKIYNQIDFILYIIYIKELEQIGLK